MGTDAQLTARSGRRARSHLTGAHAPAGASAAASAAAGQASPTFDLELEPAEEADLAELLRIWRALKATQRASAARKAFGEFLVELKDRVARGVRAPASSEIDRIIADAAGALPPLGLSLQGGALG